jgi:hypothetical protein
MSSEFPAAHWSSRPTGTAINLQHYRAAAVSARSLKASWHRCVGNIPTFFLDKYFQPEFKKTASGADVWVEQPLQPDSLEHRHAAN